MSLLGLGLTAAAAVILLDQVTKAAALALIDAPIALTPFFNLVLVWNRGVSFGMLGGLGGFGPWLLAGLAAAIVVVLLFWLRRTTTAWVAIALGLVIGGAVGNVIDRLRFGAVVDFLDVHVAGYHWPAFNVADAAICVGAVLLLLDGLRSPRHRHT